MKAIVENLQRIYEQKQDHRAIGHLEAWESPAGLERGLKSLIVGLAEYGEAYRKRFQCAIGGDTGGARAFAESAHAVITMLAIEHGRFRRDHLERLVRAICVENSVELDAA